MIKPLFAFNRLFAVVLCLSLSGGLFSATTAAPAPIQKPTQQVATHQPAKKAVKKPAGKPASKPVNKPAGKAVNGNKNGSKAAQNTSAGQTAESAAISSGPATPVSPLSLLQNPSEYLNKTVSFTGVFNSFSSLGLDYKKALRDSKDYVSFLVNRPDVTHHTIPMAEMKLIYPRSKSEAVIHLEPGDKISIKGKVFSTALNEPWLDVQEVSILEKVKTAASNNKQDD